MKLIYKLSKEALKKELKNGNEPSPLQSLEVDLSKVSKKDRELLVDFGEVSEKEISFVNRSVEADTLGLEGLLQAVRYKGSKEHERSRQEKVLLAWAQKHGSDLLLQQIQNKFDWKPQARKEFLDYTQPEGWFEPKNYVRKWVVSSPNRQQMKAYQAARKLCQNSPLLDPAIWGIQFNPDKEGRWPEELDKQGIELKPDKRGDYVLYVAKVTVFAPDNTTRVIVRPVEDF